MNRQKGIAPILIVLLIAAAVGGYLIYQKQTKTAIMPSTLVRTSPNPVASSVATSSAETTNWKTYRAPGYIGIKVKYPADKLSGDITEHMENSKDKPTQDENLTLWRTTIPLKDSMILVNRKHNINPLTNKPYNSIEEYDSRANNFSTIQISHNDAKDSGEYLNQKGEYQRDIIFFRNNYIWIIQEISPKTSQVRYLEKILPTWTFFEYSPNESGVYKDVDR